MNLPKTLLIVDDEAEIREILRESLDGTVERFFEAANGAEALKILMSQKVHAVITDFKMPVMDGITFLKKMREERFEIPCMMLTGNATVEPELRNNAFKWGIVQFLEKPINFDLLKQTVTQVIGVGEKLAKLSDDLEALCDAKNIPEAERSAFKRRERPLMVEQLLREAMNAPGALKKTA